MIASSEERIGPRRGVSDVVAIDVASSGTKLVRMRRTKDGLTVTAVAEKPPAHPGGGQGGAAEMERIALSKPFRAKHSAISVTGSKAVVRLLNLPGFAPQTEGADQTVREHVGLDGEYRLGYTVASTVRSKNEVSLVAVGLPEEEAASVLEVLGNGAPAPVSVEISALSAMTGFARGPAARFGKGSVGVIEAGANVTLLGIFAQSAPVLLRKFEFGSEQILEKIQRAFGVDHDTAVSILSDVSFDTSAALNDAMTGFLRQLAISREFVERKIGDPIQAWFVSGGLALSVDWRQQIYATVNRPVEIWNPFENLYMLPDIWPEELNGQEPRFAAPLGAAIGALEDT